MRYQAGENLPEDIELQERGWITFGDGVGRATTRLTENRLLERAFLAAGWIVPVPEPEPSPGVGWVGTNIHDGKKVIATDVLGETFAFHREQRIWTGSVDRYSWEPPETGYQKLVDGIGFGSVSEHEEEDKGPTFEEVLVKLHRCFTLDSRFTNAEVNCWDSGVADIRKKTEQ